MGESSGDGEIQLDRVLGTVSIGTYTESGADERGRVVTSSNTERKRRWREA